MPPFAQRLENGNTLICDSGNHRIIEVTRDKKTVWEYSELIGPWGGVRLKNGNTLIADCPGCYVIEVTRKKKIVWIAVYGENRVIEVAAP